MKTIKTLQLTITALLCSLTAAAHDFDVDGIYYNITNETSRTVGVTYQGSSYDEYSNEYTGCVVIPESVTYNGTTYSVTSIGEYAFYECDSLTSIVIPNSVTSIGNYAFDGCTSLKDLCIEDGDSILSLGYNSQGYMDYYTSSMGEGLFYDCPVETLYLGRNLSYNSSFSYGYSPFRYTSTLNSITISNSVTKIRSYAFEGCSGLTSIEIPNNVTSIGKDAFNSCDGIKEVHINDLEAWFNIDFGNGNANPLIYAHNLYLNGEKVTNLTIPENITEIKKYVFSGYSGLTNVEIPSGVTSIGEYAFNSCSGLTSIVIPDSVTNIGDYAFSNCAGLTSVVIGNSVTSIGEQTFQSCSKLKTIVNFSNLQFTKGSSKYGYVAYYADKVYNVPNGSIKDGFILGKLNDINTLVSYLGDATVLTLPTDYNGENYVVGANAFSNNTAITSVVIPNSVKSIDEYAFSGCTSLKEVKIGDRAVSIEKYAFKGCSSLENLKIGDGMKSIEEYAFYNCANLKEIVLGKRINYIGNYAFASSDKIESIYALPTRAINCENPTTAFHQNAYKYATLYVKESSIGSYETTEPWSKFYIEPIGDFTLTYMVDGEVYKKEKYEYDSEITPLALPEKEGHTFSGWSEIPETMPAEDITVTGSFSVNSYDVTFVVDGEVYQTVSVNYGETITLPEEPTKEGHTFSGWNEIPETMPARDVVIEGSFAANSYYVIYIVDGEEYKRESVVYGTAITLPGEPTKEGHTFSGWSEIPETMPAEDITVTGSFSVNSYDVTFVVDEEVYKTVSVNYGETIPMPEEPVKDGCTFSGWSEIPATMPAEDITITGSFYANYYTLTYMVDGEVYATVTVGYNSVIPEMEEPTKEGHTFSGWENVPETMPAQDITIIGSFTVNSYNAIFLVDNALYAMLSVNYGEAIELPEPPSKEGFVFDGWEGLPVTMPAKDIVLIAIFTDVTGVDDVKSEIGKVKIIYDLNGRAVENPTNGIYVVDGKKVLVK